MRTRGDCRLKNFTLSSYSFNARHHHPSFCAPFCVNEFYTFFLYSPGRRQNASRRRRRDSYYILIEVMCTNIDAAVQWRAPFVSAIVSKSFNRYFFQHSLSASVQRKATRTLLKPALDLFLSQLPTESFAPPFSVS